MRKILFLATAVVSSSTLFALQHSFNTQKITLDQVPPTAQQKLKNQAGAAASQIQNVDAETFDGFTTYHATVDQNGQSKDIRVDAQGNVWGQYWKTIPPAVEKTAESRIGAQPILAFHKLPVNGQAVYHFRYGQTGTPQDLFIGQGGAVVKAPPGAIFNDVAGAQSTTTTTTTATTTAPALPDQTAAGGTWVAFKDLPWPAQQTILTQSGSASASITQVRQTMRSNGQKVYHVSFQKDGQPVRLAVQQDGTLVTPLGATGAATSSTTTTTTTDANVTPLSAATKVNLSDLPPAVQTAIRTQANGAAIEDIDRGTVNGQTVYEAAYKKDGRTYELRVGADGTVMGGHFD